VEDFFKRAKGSSGKLSILKPVVKNRILNEFASALRENREKIIGENKKDLDYAKEHNLSSAMVDRLLLDKNRIEAMASSIELIASLKEPVGRVLDGWSVDSGMSIHKVSVPIGVVGIIYESRPNVTSDAAALCFKSGNVSILKGGKEASYSNIVIATIIQDVLEKNSLPRELVSLLPDSSREGVDKLIKMDRYVDLIIPRGGEGLIKYVSANSTVPVVKHDKGLCHTYIDEFADIDMAIKIVLNAKCRRVGICNAMETMLVHKNIAPTILPMLKKEFDKHKTELRGCENTTKIIEVNPATNEDFDTEYLANILSIKVVDSLDDAVEHIKIYGSGHSEAIITKDYKNGELFLNAVDAACVYINASTQFTDGGEFGFGAEVGISTNKLHARGPMGIEGLTTYKYKIYGNGDIRS